MSSTPDNLTVVFDADLLESDAQVIAQQCNCKSKNAEGLSHSIAKQFPHADVYSKRKDDSTPGTIKISGNRKRGERFVCAMFAQKYPGKPRKGDTATQRQKWFQKCLDRLGRTKSLKSVAFPYKIGCGLAGGDWDVYYGLLTKWAEENSSIEVTIISNEPEASPEVSPEAGSEPEPEESPEVVESPTGSPRKAEPVDYNKFITEHARNTTARIAALSVPQKARLLDHLLKDIRADVILSSSKVLETIETVRPDDETWVVADKVVPSSPKVGDECPAWMWIASQGEYPQLHEVEFYRFMWVQLLAMGELWNLGYFVQKYEQMSGRVCHMHDDFFPPDVFGGQPKVINAEGVEAESPGVEEAEVFVEEDGDNDSEGDEPDDGEEEVEPSASASEGSDEVEVPESSEDEDVVWGDMSLKEYLEVAPPEGYEEFFTNILENGGVDDISEYLEKEVSSGQTLYPPMSEMFTAFDLCPLEKLKVVIIGQDPYHTKGAAMGVAFGHHDTRKKIQPSLRNIFKALEEDGFTPNFDSGDLTKWCEQGVFLINTALTVRKGDAGSHASKSKTKPGPWDYFIGQLFRFLAENCEHLVVMAWGGKAQGYTKYFSSDDHHIITAPHPAASAYNPSNTEFFDHKPFSRANKQLKKWKLKSVDWNLA